MLRTCLKCAHQTDQAGTDDLAECPKCGAIYSRVEASVARERAEAAAKAKPTPKYAATEARPKRAPKPSRSLWSRVKMWSAIGLGLWLTGLFIVAALDLSPEPEARAAVAEVRRPTPPPPAVCKADDVSCIGLRERGAATGPCTRAVVAQLAYRHEWTDAWYEEKFGRVMWYQPTSSIIFHGDKLQAQNGFGAWKNLSYFCAWDVSAQRVLKAGINE